MPLDVSLARLETRTEYLQEAVDDLDTRVRIVEESTTRLSSYAAIAAFVGSICGSAFISFLLHRILR